MRKNSLKQGFTLTLFAVTMTATANLYAANTDAGSKFYLRDKEFNLKDALRFKSTEGNFSLRLGGRLHADTARFMSDNKHRLNTRSRDSKFRRARLFVSGKAFDDWRYRVEYDFASSRDFRIKSAWVGYKGFKRLTLRAGNMLEPFSLENMTSSNNTTFMERGLPKAFSPGYKVGTTVNTYGDNWSAAAGLFNGNIRNGKNEGWGTVLRLTAVPVKSRHRLLHVGAAVEYREPKTVNYGTRPEANLARKLVKTGTLHDVDHTVTVGLEAAVVYDSFSLQGEYMRVSVARKKRRSNPDFSGWYVYGSWFLTGEHRRYNTKKGAFKSIRPKSSYGAWELAARYSAVDLENSGITGGEEKDITLGINWYPNRNLRFMLNYVRVDAGPDRRGRNESPDIIQMRGQLVF